MKMLRKPLGKKDCHMKILRETLGKKDGQKLVTKEISNYQLHTPLPLRSTPHRREKSSAQHGSDRDAGCQKHWQQRTIGVPSGPEQIYTGAQRPSLKQCYVLLYLYKIYQI